MVCGIVFGTQLEERKLHDWGVIHYLFEFQKICGLQTCCGFETWCCYQETYTWTLVKPSSNSRLDPRCQGKQAVQMAVPGNGNWLGQLELASL